MASSRKDRDATRDRYVLEYPRFQDAAIASKTHVDSLLRQLAITDASVKVRAKDIASFVKKLRKYDEGFWERTTDKVGAQIVVHTLAEVRRLRQALEAGHSRFQYVRTEDKSIYLGDVRSLRYTGVHVQVVVPGLETSDGEPIECEIQLRTQAQDVWAYLEHGLVYKPVIEPSPAIARKIARLSVLVEMFDEEVDTAMTQLAEDPRYVPAVLLHDAERLYLTFVDGQGEPELSIEVLSTVANAISEDERTNYQAALSTFVESHRDRIADAIRDYGADTAYANDFRYFLFSQPELLVLWERIESKPRTLVQAIGGTDLLVPVGVLAEVIGQPLGVD